ncbi:MAG TPA: hypothetical protein VFS60_13500 [Thermoanaerobaculia bacterium]|nr:hypothetical protein [Thermoanaerobaculia bacterium]
MVVWFDERIIEDDRHTIGHLAELIAELLSSEGVGANDLEALEFLALAPATSRTLASITGELQQLAEASTVSRSVVLANAIPASASAAGPALAVVDRSSDREERPTAAASDSGAAPVAADGGMDEFERILASQQRFTPLAPRIQRDVSPATADGEDHAPPGAAIAQQLIRLADRYLDEPLTPAERHEIADYVRESGLRAPPSGLQGRVVELVNEVEAGLRDLSIVDSDPAWPQSVARLWAGSDLASALISGDIDAARNGLRSTAQMYLDDGAPPRLDAKKLISDQTFSNVAQEVSLAARSAVAALETVQHSDSDSHWPRVVVGRWLQLAAAAQSGDGSTLDDNSSGTFAAVPLQGGQDSSGPTELDELRNKILTTIRVYSPKATTPLALARMMQASSSASAGTPRSAREAFLGIATPPPRFDVAMASDQALAASVIDELGRRGLSLVSNAAVRGDPPDHLVLVSEWDTLYGRSLPFMFEVELTKRATPGVSRYEDSYWDRLNDQIQAPSNVHRFTYLRGLDGVTPESAARSGSTKRDAPRADVRRDASPMEENAARVRDLEGSEGSGQLDMIRRVGNRIADLDQELREERRGRVRAIGVLGSDFHDKLLVLQALRAQFPDAIFFTTDLDARLLQPRWYSWTHNLLVASSYGLELAPHLQCRIPAFRDGYSTAIFAATLAGLQEIDLRPVRAGQEDKPDVCLPVTQAHLQRLQPLLFEIGRHGAIELGPLADRLGTHPRLTTARPNARKVVLLGLPILIGLFWWLSLPLGRLLSGGPDDASEPRRRRRIRRRRLWTTAIATTVMVGAWGIAIADARADGEPLYWLQGVSTWPSELLLVIGALIGILVLARAICEVRRDDELLAPHFLASQAATVTPTPAPVHQLLASWRELTAPVTEWPCGDVSASAVWDHYYRRGQPLHRAARVGAMVAAIAIIMATFAYLFGVPDVPVRSDLARHFHWVATSFATLVLTVLALFVFDATRLCVRFVDALVGEGKCPAFPANDRNEALAGQELGVPLEEASDLLALRLIARRTSTIGRLLLYPFLLTGVFLAARSRIFDSWSSSSSITALVGIIMLALLANAIELQWGARRARQRALRRIEAVRLRRIGEGDAAAERTAKVAQLVAMREEVRQLDQGAFASWSTNPVFGALLLPLGGWLLDFFVQLLS